MSIKDYDAEEGALPERPKVRWVTRIGHTIRITLLFCAFFFAILPSILKMYETSHWFREYGDPSLYDVARDWFDNPNLPMQPQIDSSKVLIRLYFFILPYIVSGCCLILVHMLPKYFDYSESVKHPYTPKGLSVRKLTTPGFLVKLGAPKYITLRFNLRDILHGRTLIRAVPFPKWMIRMGAPDSVSIGEIIGVVIFLILNLGTIGVRVRRSLPRGSRKNLYLVDEGDAGKADIPAFSWPAAEVWGKTLGVIAIVNLGWYLLMPIGRNSVLLEALGITWDRAIKYHRWVGFYSVFIMFVHGLLYFMVMIYGNGHPVYDPDGVMLKHNLLAWGCKGYEEGDEKGCDADQHLLLRINMYGIFTLVLVLEITIFALPYFRRYLFEWFFYVHHLFLLVLFFICLHYKGSVIYLIPGVAIYTIDRLMGLLAYKNCCLAKTEMVSSDVLEVCFKVEENVHYKAGQYVFVNVPSVSHLEWHPYSLTSGPNANPGEIFFHLKEAGESENSWTRRVVEAGRAGQLDMRIDAFYGDYEDELAHKKAVCLVGGGIGVTPMMSMGMDLIAKDPSLPVTIFWVCRTVQEFEIFSNTLYQAKSRCRNLTVKVWITLSLPEPKISKEAVMFLDTDEEKCDLVLSVLKPPPLLKDKRMFRESDVAANYLFKKSPPGLEPLANAVAMTVAMIFALVGYTSSVSFAREKGMERQGVKTLVDMGFIMGMILIVFVIILLARPLLQSDGKKEFKVVVSHFNEDDEDGLTDTENDDSMESGSRGIDTDTYRAMLEGRIGCRPNMEDEFRELAFVHQRDMNEDFDTVGVLACGPKAMTNAINAAVHNTGPLSTFFDAGKIENKDGTDATFAFVEEDWEW